MKINYGDNGAAAQEVLPLPAAPAIYQPQPPVAPPRIGKIFSAGFHMAVGMLLLMLALFSAETFAPENMRPSAVMGGYQGRLQVEIRARDLETQAMYDAWVQQAQISVNQQQVGYQGQVQAIIANYQAAYERARLFAEATTRIQQDYTHQIMIQKRQQQEGSGTVLNWAETLANVLRPFDPNTAEKIDEYADDLYTRMRSKLDDAVQQGITINIEGWDTGLPSPEQVRADLEKVKPIVIPAPPRISRDAKQARN